MEGYTRKKTEKRDEKSEENNKLYPVSGRQDMNTKFFRIKNKKAAPSQKHVCDAFQIINHIAALFLFSQTSKGRP